MEKPLGKLSSGDHGFELSHSDLLACLGIVDQAVNLPDAALGLTSCFYKADYAHELEINPQAGDFMNLEGERGDAGESIKSPGAVGDHACVTARNGTDWYVFPMSTDWVWETP